MISNKNILSKFFLRLSKFSNCRIRGSIYNTSICSYHFKSSVYGFKAEGRSKQNEDVCADLLLLRNENPNVLRYVDAYRTFGHLKADVNPLFKNVISVPELSPNFYGLSHEASYPLKGIFCNPKPLMTLSELEEELGNIYCGPIGAEFMHLPTSVEREWFAENLENLGELKLSNEEKLVILSDLLKSQAWDLFLTNKFSTVKRYGGEGAETIVTYCREVFKCLARDGASDVIIGMAHRGRLNLLTGLLHVPLELLFRKMKGLSEFPENAGVTGDVLSHIVSSIDLEFDADSIHVSMFPNPSHLEAINPVVAGKTRAKQRELKEGVYSSNDDIDARAGDKVVCMQIHGDAAIGGQGILQETLAISAVPHFEIGGTLHMCTNNQIGYTTPSERTRSSRYATDVAKICSFPVLHVNGDDPEAVALATRLAVAYQRKFRRDIFVDILCWRRWGHNELDNPRFTNPEMYKIIDNHASVPDLYADSLISQGILSIEEKDKIMSDFTSKLSAAYKNADTYEPEAPHLKKQWSGISQAPPSIESWETGVDIGTLKYVGTQSVNVPEDFNVHPNIQRAHINARRDRLLEGSKIDWGTAEALAMGSLLNQGYNIRLCGQDVGRGTFSQRHCMMVDQVSSDVFIPLNDMHKGEQGHIEVVNSILSEEAVLGFEYGVSVENPYTLCIWEAQFGDFFNGAQIIIDTFVSSGETKWLMQSGLTMILPHGYDGAGPEHSSCHYERFLQNCDSREDAPDSEQVNWGIVFPTTPAQYFHLLRRQMIRNYRKPLVIVGPKALLRLPAAASNLNQMGPDTHFLPVIGDDQMVAENVRKVIFVTGKHYYNLITERKEKSINDTAIIRVESLCPFPTKEINDELAKYVNAEKFVWAQEEHRNMGAWFFVNPRFRNLCGTELIYVGRQVLGTTAVGIGELHKAEVKFITEKPFTV